MRARLEELERSGLDPRSGELLVVLCWLVRDQVAIDEAELHAARRRAMFVLAAGGDPHRELELDSVAAERLAGSRLAVVRPLVARRRARRRVGGRRLAFPETGDYPGPRRGDLDTGTAPPPEAAAQPAPRAASTAVLTRRRPLLPQPRLLRPRRRTGRRGRGRALPAAAAGLVDPGAARPAVRPAGAAAGLPDGEPAGRAGRDRRRPRPGARRQCRPRRRRRRRRLAREPGRARPLASEPCRPAGGRPPRAAGGRQQADAAR